MLRYFLIAISLLVGIGCQQGSKKERQAEKVDSELDCHPAGGRTQMLLNAAQADSSGAQVRSSDSTAVVDSAIAIESTNQSIEGMVLIPSGEFMMGAEGPLALPREYPKHPVKVDGFYMDTHEVTNAEFRAFVEATGYKTIAERPIDWEELKKQVPPGTPKPPDERTLR